MEVGPIRLFIREQSIMLAMTGETLDPDSSFGKVVIALASELRERRSMAHKCLQCGSGVGIFDEHRLCPACSND